MQVQNSDKIMKSMGMGRVFKDNEGRINCIDFHRTEDLLVTGGEDDTIRVYNTAKGVAGELYPSKKYGVQNLCFTHHVHSVIFASNRGTDHALRYHSLASNSFIKYFKGHTERVVSLNMSPKNDLFMSAAQDKTVRLWDLRTSVCQGILTVPAQPCASFDQQGLVFGVATESGIIKLYDVRSYDKGPFDTFQVQEEVNQPAPFSQLKFSPDGKLLLTGAEGRIYVIDAFTGEVLRRFSSGTPESGLTLEAGFSADNQHILAGCEDAVIRVWNVRSGLEVAQLRGHASVPACVKFAPRRLLIASACSALALWVPNLAVLETL